MGFLSKILKKQERNPDLEKLRAIAEKHAPIARAKEQVDRAISLRELGRFDEALSILRKTLKRYPEYTPTILVLGNTLMAAGQLTEAQEFLKKVIDIPDEGNEIPWVEIYAIMGEIHLKFVSQETTREGCLKRINLAAACFHESLDCPLPKGGTEEMLVAIQQRVQKRLLYAIVHAWGAGEYLRNEDNQDEFNWLAGRRLAAKAIHRLDKILRPEKLADLLESTTEPTELVKILRWLRSVWNSSQAPANVWVEGFLAGGALCLGDTPWAEENGPVEEIIGLDVGWLEDVVEYNKREHQGNDVVECPYRLYAEGHVRLANARAHSAGLGMMLACTGFGDDGEIIMAMPGA